MAEVCGERVRVGETNPEQAVSLEDRLAKLLPDPLSEADFSIMKRVGELARSNGSWRNDMLLELRQLKVRFVSTRNWLDAVQEIAKDMGTCKRSVQRLSEPPKVAASPVSAQTNCAANESDEITPTEQILAERTRRIGRHINV
jgi:hypothetical protein